MKKIFFLTALLISGGIVITSFKTSVQELHEVVPVQTKTAAAKWTLDKSHSNVKFTVTHMVVSEVDGSFKTFDATMEGSKPDFSDAKVMFTVDVASVDTDNERRDNHLKGDDFFNAEKFPQMKFESSSFKSLGNNKYELKGDLTIRDITKPVTFEATHLGNTTDRGKVKAGFKASAKVNRFDYNLKWDRATEAGSLVVAKEVTININAAFVQQ